MNLIYTLEYSTKKEINELLEKAYSLQLINWNDGMIYSDFIKALWRTFLKHDAFCEKANRIQNTLGESNSLELLSSEIDLYRK
ncbi:hypothetical protein [Ascidiimonas sp. W6]|uniref:hypothetical protein n=1 Tax=Ascidiimonas meishanensis TaxID=3128903 RepID=UPI0030ECE7EA